MPNQPISRLHKYFGSVPVIDTERKNTCFVMMPFGKPWSNRLWNAIQATLGQYSIRCIRADEQGGVIPIQDIAIKIAQSQFLIADTTRKNPNVMYEVGVAHALEREVILLSQSLHQLPFDVRHMRYIKYQPTPAGLKMLKEDLRIRILEFDRRVAPFPHDIAISGKTQIANPREAFLGEWRGVWRHSDQKRRLRLSDVSHTLVVEKILGDDAALTYFWGDSLYWALGAGYRREYGHFVRNQLVIQWRDHPTDIRIKYSLRKDGKALLGKRTDPAGQFTATLSKVR